MILTGSEVIFYTHCEHILQRIIPLGHFCMCTHTYVYEWKTRMLVLIVCVYDKINYGVTHVKFLQNVRFFSSCIVTL